MKWILTLGPILGMVRVPGIGLIYADLVNGLPTIFGHFAMNLLAFHQVLVFICVKSVQVPYVPEGERFLVGRIGSREFHMFRCIVRYGYKEVQQEDYDFENKLVSKILEFIERQGNECVLSPMLLHSDDMTASDADLPDLSYPHTCSSTLSGDEQGTIGSQITKAGREPMGLECSEWTDEKLEILKAKDSGVAYIIGHSQAKAKQSSSPLKKFAIDIVFAFLTRNCRGPDVVLNVPHSSLLEVGMVYYV